MRILFFLLFYLVSLLAMYLFLKSRNKDVTFKSNYILRDILEESFNHSSLSVASQNILKLLKKYYEVDYVTIYINTSRGLYTVASNVGGNYLNKLEKYSNELTTQLENFISRTNIGKGGSLTYETASERGICFSNFTPLVWDDELIGAILIENRNSDIKKSKRIELYDTLIQNIALVLNTIIYYDNMISKIMIDGLTGVYNRRFIDEKLPEEINLHRNLKIPFSIAILDIDYFKKVNDEYGHQFGDLTLKEISKFIKNQIREVDWIARYGGEEFIIFFSKVSAKEIYSTVEDLRRKLSQLIITNGTISNNITVSIGLAEYNRDIEEVGELIKAADKSLYNAKNNGRNQVSM